MAEQDLKQVMLDAIVDADSLEKFINGSDSETVLTRLSAEYPTLQKAIKQMFENGSLPATLFKTKVLMEASSLEDSSYAVVTDNGADNGLYFKEDGAWVKSEYDMYNKFELLESRINSLEKGARYYPESAFNVPEGGNPLTATTNKTKWIPTEGFSVLFLRLSLLGVGTFIETKLKNGEEGVLLTGSDTKENYLQFIDIPDNVTHIRIKARSKINESYRADLAPFFLLGVDKKSVLRELPSIFESLSFTGFPIEGHAQSDVPTYNSTRLIMLMPGTVVKYNTNSKGGAGMIYNLDNNTSTRVMPAKGVVNTDFFGLLQLSTRNSTHPEYDANYPVYVNVFYPSTVKTTSEATASQEITGSYLPSLHLKCIRQITFKDGTDRLAMQYLWYDDSYNFYISDTKQGDRKFAFTFNPADHYGHPPHFYAMGFDNDGNILCLLRTETMDYSSTTSENTWSDDVRKNPFIFIKENGYKPQVINFDARIAAGEDVVRPCGWAMDCGFMNTDGMIMITEYTRPAVRTANTWKVTYPTSDPNNWKRVQSFEINRELWYGEGMKHLHSVDLDPYTGIIYTSSGDSDLGSGIYASTDNGDTFTTILAGQEAYSRILGLTFTKDWIYWATDANGAEHNFYKVARLPSGVMDVDNIITILTFPSTSQATHATIYMKSINALVFLSRADQVRASVPIEVWDFKNNVLKTVDNIYGIDGAIDNVGFRCECFEYIPRDNSTICGFGEKAGFASTYENKIGLLGNTTDPRKRVNNIIVTIDRVGDDFFASYSTVS